MSAVTDRAIRDFDGKRPTLGCMARRSGGSIGVVIPTPDGPVVGEIMVPASAKFDGGMGIIEWLAERAGHGS